LGISADENVPPGGERPRAKNKSNGTETLVSSRGASELEFMGSRSSFLPSEADENRGGNVTLGCSINLRLGVATSLGEEGRNIKKG
jgi:hypothetical protein